TINTKVCLDEKNDKEEDNKVDDGDSTDSEGQLNMNSISKPLHPIKDSTETFSTDRYPTLLVVYPIIELLKSKFVADPNLPLTDDDLNEEYD
ncbi:13156_t:CDS:2, partial [Cetraspora pellucida]